MIMVETPSEPDVGSYRSALTGLDIGDVSVTEISDPAAELTGGTQFGVMIRIEQSDGGEATQDAAIAAAKSVIAEVDAAAKILATDSVGGKVSSELLVTGITAVLFSFGAVLIYIWLRFEWQFSVGSIAALLHDVLLNAIGL